MKDARRQQQVQRGRSLEARGDVDGASRAYLEGGALGEAARVLFEAQRFAEAGQLLIASLGRPLEQLNDLRGRERIIAEKAAECHAHAGDAELAQRIRSALEGGSSRPPSDVKVFGAEPSRVDVEVGRSTAPHPERTSREAGWREVGSGSAQDKMIEELLAAGRTGAAARVAWEAGRLEEASGWFVALGFHYEAGMCLADLNELEGALRELLQVPEDHKYYRRAAARAIEVAHRLDRFDFEVDRFVSRFLWTTPERAKEVPAYVTAARLYGRHGFGASAREVLERVLQLDPQHQEASRLLGDLDQRGSTRSSEPPRAAAPRRRSPSNDSFPDLPPLDSYIRGRAPSSKPPHGSSSGPSRPANEEPVQPARAAAADSGEAKAAGATLPASEPPPSEDAAVQPGDLVASRYRILGQLGVGGMATVWRAHDEELNLEIALKMMHPGAASERWLPRFRQELSLARVLTHKNIVRVYDIGSHAGSRFISMELLDGVALDEMFDQPVPFVGGIQYIVQVCSGLRVAHDARIIHRDIKASNIFVTRAGVVKLTDFGIAKAPGPSDATERGITVAGAIIGTPEYMSPEQIDDAASVTPESDIYSLGVVLYEMFTLTCPFEHDSLMMVLRMHHEHAPEPPKSRNPGMPDSLQDVILRCLEKDPAKRYPNATELARALRSITRDLR